MGMLRTYDIEIIVDESGNETKNILVQGMTVNGLLLGTPIELDTYPVSFGWDDSSLPNGTIDRAGIITLDEEGAI